MVTDAGAACVHLWNEFAFVGEFPESSARVGVEAEDGFLGIAIVAHRIGAALGDGDCGVA